MASAEVPHLHNEGGHKEILVRSKRIMCIGALPPFDHPHVFLEMGADNRVMCPYCGTIYTYDESITPLAEPASALYSAAQE